MILGSWRASLAAGAGHVKVTDFGAARGVTESAQAALREAQRRTIADLRNGDWQPASKKNGETGLANATLATDEEFDDSRVEGTTLYLAPECVEGAGPTMAADAWALGCVLHFCVEARPKFSSKDEETSRALILAFDGSAGANVRALNGNAAALELVLLSREPCERPSMASLVSHEFFAGVDVRSCHARAAQPLTRAGRDKMTRFGASNDNSQRVSDAAWAQRQYSLMWAPVASGAVGGAAHASEYGDLGADAAFRAWFEDYDLPNDSDIDVGAPFLKPLR